MFPAAPARCSLEKDSVSMCSPRCCRLFGRLSNIGHDGQKGRCALAPFPLSGMRRLDVTTKVLLCTWVAAEARIAPLYHEGLTVIARADCEGQHRMGAPSPPCLLPGPFRTSALPEIFPARPLGILTNASGPGVFTLMEKGELVPMLEAAGCALKGA